MASNRPELKWQAAEPAGNRARQDLSIPICPSLFDDLIAGGRLGASWRELQNRRALIKAASGVVEPNLLRIFPFAIGCRAAVPALRQDYSGPDVVLAHDLAPDAHLFREENGELLGAG